MKKRARNMRAFFWITGYELWVMGLDNGIAKKL
jgi:hypothetical protein